MHSTFAPRHARTGRLDRSTSCLRRRPPPRLALAVRVVVVLALSAVFEPGEWGSPAVLVAAVLLERAAAEATAAAGPYATNLYGVEVRDAPVLDPRTVSHLTTAGLACYAALCLTEAPDLAMTLLGVAMLVPSVVELVDGEARIRARDHAEPALRDAVRGYVPTFVVHWQAPAGSTELARWLPCLEALDRAFVIVLRNPATYAQVCALTTRPVVVRSPGSDLDAVVVDSLRAIVYLNDAPENADLARFAGLDHVRLHADGDEDAPGYGRLALL